MARKRSKKTNRRTRYKPSRKIARTLVLRSPIKSRHKTSLKSPKGLTLHLLNTQQTQQRAIQAPNPPPKRAKKAFKLQFTSPPSKVLKTCIRRAQRNQIMHAIKKAGQAGQKKPTLNTRNIKC